MENGGENCPSKAFGTETKFSLGSRKIIAPKTGLGSWREISNHSFTPLSLGETLLGGQSFVWLEIGANQWRGAIKRSVVDLVFREDRLYWRSNQEYPFSESQVRKYLWIDDSYARAIEEMPWRSDSVLRKGIEAFPGLRILAQPFDETLFYFLLSSAKSIPQIKSCGEAVAQGYGEKLAYGIGSFPGWNRLFEIPELQLRKLKLGYRAKYVAGVAQFLASRSGWLEETASLPYDQAKIRLMEMPGVGPKIADCALLFGAGKLEAFPIDTWMDKVLESRYELTDWSLSQKLTFARIHFGKFAGLAQQFLFSSERHGVFKTEERL